MGVPALFRWLSRKYPRIVEQVVESSTGSKDAAADLAAPNPNGFEVDNLFLDMNGIIHPCCHPQDKPAPPNEDEMMKAIFNYLDRIMSMIRPRRLLYLAIDGVAPRAKMNQQRSRRFRSAREAREKKELQLQDGAETVSVDSGDDPVFDSNVITPGTPFMQLVTDSLKFYLYHRMNSNPGWAKVKVVLSDWTVPGEGEHKIVDFIRRQRLDPEYDANQENVIYGLDADLIMLTMATHEARFRVLREDVFWEEEQRRGQCRNCLQPGHFASDCKNPAAELAVDPHMVKPFIFLNVVLLREYLEVEMRPSSHDFPFDPERAIDDWIFLCFFVGNDFLPHLPSLELRDGAIDTLLDIYKSRADEFQGPLTKDGRVNFGRVWVILEGLARQEENILRRRKEREDRREENAKRRRVDGGRADGGKVDAETPEQVRQAAQTPNRDSGPTKRARDQSDDSPIVDEVRLHEPGARSRYYISKFGKDPAEHPEFVRSVCRSYLEGVAWVMAYYYQGCPSWKWFYPHHYAPFAADFVEYLGEDGMAALNAVKFELGRPFRPFDQLMSVFPAASAEHIPEPFRWLMKDADSGLLEYYPEEFSVDLNGKKFAWQGVALLPFIDEDRLLAALEKIYPELGEEQLRLNRRGHDILFVGEQSTLFGFLNTIESDAEGIWPLDVLLSKGLAGSVRLCKEAHPIGHPIPMLYPSEPPIQDNQVAAVFYYPPGVSGQETTLVMHFPARMLPTARRPASVLTAEERAAVRQGGPQPRASPYHSMNREWAQKQEQRHHQPSSSGASHSYFKPPNPEYKRY